MVLAAQKLYLFCHSSLALVEFRCMNLVDEAAEALEQIETLHTTGKIVVVP